jgi:hypothetical protein
MSSLSVIVDHVAVERELTAPASDSEDFHYCHPAENTL